MADAKDERKRHDPDNENVAALRQGADDPDRQRLIPLDPWTAADAAKTGYEPHGGKHPCGVWQASTLIGYGLRRDHSLLEIGCGDLRLSVPAIRYLETGLYVGTDHNDRLIRRGAHSVTDSDWAKDPSFFLGDDFAFTVIGRQFDFVWAHDLWSQLDLSEVGLCMEQVMSVLAPNGVFMAAFFAAAPCRPFSTALWHPTGGEGSGHQQSYGAGVPYHHPEAVLREMADLAGLGFQVLPERSHNGRRIARMHRQGEAATSHGARVVFGDDL